MLTHKTGVQPNFGEFPYRDCPKRGKSNPRSVDLGGVGMQKGPKSTVSVVHKATPHALPTLFGQSQKGNSAKFVCRILHRSPTKAARNAPKRRRAQVR